MKTDTSHIPANINDNSKTTKEIKVAMLTAAGSGIGAAAAEHLASEGYKIAILSSSGKGEALALRLGGIGLTGSNQSSADLQQLANSCIERWGRIDVLVNSAGHGPKGDVVSLSDEQWQQGMQLYLMNVIKAVRVVTPIMQAQAYGSIVNVSSFATFEPDAQFPTSAVFRAALASYCKLFSDEYAPDNIRINNVLPGYIDSLAETEARLKQIPMKRYGTVAEMSSLIGYLASKDAAYITGQNIRIDGGLTRAV